MCAPAAALASGELGLSTLAVAELYKRDAEHSVMADAGFEIWGRSENADSQTEPRNPQTGRKAKSFQYLIVTERVPTQGRQAKPL